MEASRRSLEELVPAFLLARGPLSADDLDALRSMRRPVGGPWRERAAPFLAGLVRSLNDIIATDVDGDRPLATYIGMRRLAPLFSEFVEFTIAEHMARKDEGRGEDEGALGVAVVEVPAPGSSSGKIRVTDT